MSSHNSTIQVQKTGPTRGVLDWIEWAGNKLPDPSILFMLLALAVILLSAVGSAADWSVQPVKPQVVMETQQDAQGNAVTDAAGIALQVPKKDADGNIQVELVESGAPLEVKSLLTADGIYWMFSSMLRNFAQMPALPLIFVAMLGIGLAEKFGFFSALMRWLAFMTPKKLMTPAVVFLGANSSVASDAGYIILPPLAAALFLAVGRHPVAGLAAAFAGVAGGFGAGLFPTGGDGVLTGFAQDAARVIDPNYSVTILHNYYFKIVSAVAVTLGAWYVTDRIVEPRLLRLHGDELQSNETSAMSEMALKSNERKALVSALGVMVIVLGIFAALILPEGMPLHGDGKQTLANGRVLVQQSVDIQPKGSQIDVAAHDVLTIDPLVITEKETPGRLVETPGTRWSQVIVPFILIVFLIPGLVYGYMTQQLKSQSDAVDAMYHGIRSIVPVLVILFFISQFVNYFAYSHLDRMLAYLGGSMLFDANLPIPLLLCLFVIVVIFGDFAMSGMLSKFGVLAPIFIPMFMMVGMSPELTTAAYRIGDSVVNIVTPLNSYLLIILAVFQKYRKGVGLGSLIALMIPYSIVLGIIWTALLLAWYFTGLDLGPQAPLHYLPGSISTVGD
jgi:aminobenzoyl-glutamate transport protein